VLNALSFKGVQCALSIRHQL